METLQVDLRGESDRLRRLGVIFNLKILQLLEPHLINKSTNDEYYDSMMPSETEVSIRLRITER